MIYLDNASTTQIREEALNKMMPFLIEKYGNPSSKYELGFESKEAIENARRNIANTLNVDVEEIYFTSGSTESINYIFRSHYPYVIDSGCIEHYAIINQPNYLNTIGIDKKTTRYSIDDLDNVNSGALVVQYANNEIGTIHPIKDIGNYCHDNNILFVTDATQAYGHIPIDCKKENIDVLIASGHKFGAPKGVGFIYINKDCKLKKPIQSGGQQENGFRAGTENVYGIVGMGEAARVSYENLKSEYKNITNLRNKLYGLITNNITTAKLNGTADWRYRLPGNLNFRFEGIKGEELQSFLGEHGICVSTGSACHSKSNNPSNVLMQIGLTPEEANSSIRFSIGANNTLKDIAQTFNVLQAGVDILRR